MRDMCNNQLSVCSDSAGVNGFVFLFFFGPCSLSEKAICVRGWVIQRKADHKLSARTLRAPGNFMRASPVA